MGVTDINVYLFPKICLRTTQKAYAVVNPSKSLICHTGCPISRGAEYAVEFHGVCK
jgi:hypothetical protein